jgi:hypothetical protein
LVRLGSIRTSYTLGVFAARCSTQTPRGAQSVTREGPPAPSRKHRNGRGTSNKQGRKGTSRREPSRLVSTRHVAVLLRLWLPRHLPISYDHHEESSDLEGGHGDAQHGASRPCHREGPNADVLCPRQIIARPSLYLLPFRMWVTRLWVTHVQKRFVFDS